MALVDDLEAAISGEFDPSALATSARAALDAVRPVAGPLDLSAATTALAVLENLDLTDLEGTASALAGQVTGAVGPDVLGGVAAPLAEAVRTAEAIAAFDLDALAAALGQGTDGAGQAPASTGGAGGALVRVDAAVAGLGLVRATGAFDLLDLVAPGAEVGERIDVAATVVTPVLTVLDTLRALADVAQASGRAGSTGTAITAALGAGGLGAALAAVDAAVADLDQAGDVAAADPTDAARAQALADALAAAAGTLRTAVDGLATVLDAVLAATAAADVPGLATRVDAASARLLAFSAGPVAAFAALVRGWLDPLARLTIGPGPPDVDAFVAEVRPRVAQLTAVVDGLDPAQAGAAVAGGLDGLLGPFHAIEDAAGEVVGRIRAALEGVQRAVEAVDLTSLATAIREVLAPLVAAAGAVQGAVAGAAATLADLAADVEAGAATVTTTIGEVRTTIDAAFGQAKGVLDAVDIAGVQATIEAGTTSMAEALRGVPLAPVFSTVADAIDGTADVVGAVPLDLLPDSARQEVVELAAPIKAIDFDAAVAQPLSAELRAILDALQADALAVLTQAAAALVAALDEFDPAVPIAAIEAEAFEPLLAHLRAVDPDALLAPVTAAVAAAKAAVAGIDLDALLAPVDAAFDEAVAAIRTIEPAALVEPVTATLDELRATVADALRLEQWPAQLDALTTVLVGPLAGVDAAAVERVVDGLVDVLGEAGAAAAPSGRAVTAVCGVLGLGTEATRAFVDAVDWVGGRVDPVAQVGERFTSAAGALDAAAATVAGLDVAGLVRTAQARLDATAAAVAALPAGSALRDALTPALAAISPTVVLTPVLDRQPRCVTALREATPAARALAAAGRSQLEVVARGLQQALAPLRELTGRLRALLTRAGAVADDPASALRLLAVGVRDADVFDPLVDAVVRVVTGVPDLVRVAVVEPVSTLAADLQALLDALDLRALTAEVDGLPGEVADQVDALRPSALLADVLGPAEEALAAVAAFDPVAPVQASLDAIRGAVDACEALRPTVALAPVTDLYQQVVDLVAALDVERVVRPLLDELDGLEAQLEGGLDVAGAAIGRLQDALPA